ncbi:MAG: putative Fe-S cluster assembly protein SufT [Verrucomicrobiota bacterium]
MIEETDRILSRDVKATLIPHGESMELPEGSRVTITHRLGGNYTIMTENGMFRIGGEDADALGEEPEVTDFGSSEASGEGPPDEEAIWSQLKKVFDPEIPVNIVDLGLVYSMESLERDDGGYKVNVAMTLTAPGCGMGPSIAEDARNKVVQVPGVEEAQVDIVWDPPWNQDMISETGKMELGLI